MDTPLPEEKNANDCGSEEAAISLLTEEDYLEMIKKLRIDLSDRISETELIKLRLRDRDNEVEALTHELNECRLAMIENGQDQTKKQDQCIRAKGLEDDYVKLMNEYLVLGENYEHFKQNMMDKYLAKTHIITHLECLMSSGSLQRELEDTKSELDAATTRFSLASSKIKNLEEELTQKEKRLVDLRKALDDAKVTHKHEIIVHEEYIQSLRNTVVSYEKTLLNYVEPNISEDNRIK